MAATGSVLVLAAATALLWQPLAAQLARDPTGIAADPTAEPVALLPPDPEMTAYISGSVLMSNAGVVPKETIIELVCGGFTRATDQVGPEGAFDIELSGRGSGSVDATQISAQALGVPQPNHLGVVNMSNCVVRAELPGHQSSEIQLGIRSVFDSPDVGEVVLSSAEGILGHTISPSIARAPKKALQSYEWALKQVGKPRPNLRQDSRAPGVSSGSGPELRGRLETSGPGPGEPWDARGCIGRIQTGSGWRPVSLSRLHAHRAVAGRVWRPSRRDRNGGKKHWRLTAILTTLDSMLPAHTCAPEITSSASRSRWN